MMVENYPLLMICLQITSSVTSTGADSKNIPITGGINKLAPNCEAAVKNICEKDKLKKGGITKIEVKLQECRLLCYSNGSTYVSHMDLPNGMPCALGATCQNGNCICEACNTINPRSGPIITPLRRD
uniref:Putative salivary secreted protein n=1 Tax=Ixodes ricinus TaxID=34613 RepID=A0A6B0UQM4_IXORI